MPRTDDPIDRQILKELVKRVGRLERARSKTPLRNQAAAAAGGGFDAFFRMSQNSVSVPNGAGSTTLQFAAADEGAGIETRIFGSASGWSYDDDSVTVPTGTYLIGGSAYWSNSAAGVFHTIEAAMISGYQINGQTNELPTGGGMQACGGPDVNSSGSKEIKLLANHTHSSGRVVDNYGLWIIRLGAA